MRSSMGQTVTIPIEAARRLAISRQGLDGHRTLPPEKEGVAKTIEHLGYVQIDTVSVVRRAHHHVLWSRRPDYHPWMLEELQGCDRRIFEFWTHASSYLPMSDYRYYLPAMQGFASSPRTRKWFKENPKLAKAVMNRIRAEGPLASRDFETPGGSRGSWWHRKPAKRALEILLGTGELMVSERRNFQRFYDLTDRVLPAGIDTTRPDPDETARFIVGRVLSAHGIASSAPMRRWAWDSKAIPAAVGDMLAEGEIVRIEVEGLEGVQYYSLASVLDQHEAMGPARELHILSPFDNLVIWRDRLRKLFNFDYVLECYHPPAKRRYGYFCLPILWGDRFVGRLDAKADRKERRLLVHKIAFEGDMDGFAELIPDLVVRLKAFADFNGCEGITVDKVEPRGARTELLRELQTSAN